MPAALNQSRGDSKVLEETIREAHAAIKLPEGWAWGWDGRYKAALLVVRPSVAEELRQCLQSHFEHIWTHRMLSMLPRDINDLVNSLDGIRGGQSLFQEYRVRSPALVCLVALVG